MRRWLPALLVLLGACASCSRQAAGLNRAGPPEPGLNRWAEAQHSHVLVQVAPLGEVANNGLLLPIVSPDGKWTAYLEFAGREQPDLDCLFSGERVEPMSLHLKPTTVDGLDRLICPSGALWPAWSANSSHLAYVRYDQTGRCALGVYDVSNQTTRTLTPGLANIAMPAVSPDGRYVAVISPAARAGSSRMYVVDLQTASAVPCPAEQEDESHFWPQWTADERIVYILARGERSWVAHWGPNRFPPETCVEIRMGRSRMAGYQALAGLGRPLSPDDKSFAYYDTAGDRVVLADLRKGERIELRVGTRFGCWLDSRRFIAATDKEMLMFTGSDTSARLMGGPWLPRGTARGTNEVILCTRGTHSRALAVSRMTVETGR